MVCANCLRLRGRKSPTRHATMKRPGSESEERQPRRPRASLLSDEQEVSSAVSRLAAAIALLRPGEADSGQLLASRGFARDEQARGAPALATEQLPAPVRAPLSLGTNLNSAEQLAEADLYLGGWWESAVSAD